MKKRIFFILAAMALVFAACSSPAPQVIEKEVVITQEVIVEKEVEVLVTPDPNAKPEPQAGGTLTIGKASEAVGLDPHLVTAASSFEITAQVYNQLVDLDDDYVPVPELAESWENPDELTFIFTLRQGVLFHNGREMTAEDVVYSFNRIKAEETASPWATQLALIESIEAPDTYTVKINLSEPFGAFMSTIASPWAAIVPKETVEANGNLQSVMDGTGPFMLKEYVEGTKTVLLSNPHYFGGVPMIDGITYNIIPDEAARIAALRTGEIQMTSVNNGASAGLAARIEGVSVESLDTTDYYLLGINTAKAPFDDVRVRQAMSLAIDRQALINSVFFGEGMVSGPIVPTLGEWAVPLEELSYYQPDVEAAKALLAEAGYTEEKPCEFSITVGAKFPQFSSIALVLQSQLNAAGFKVTLDQVEWGTFVRKWVDRDFETFVSYNGSGNDPDRALYPALTTGGSVNAFQYSNEELDALLNAARTTVNTDERKAYYHDAAVLISKEVPLLFLATRTAYVAVSDVVQGFKLSSVDAYRGLRDVWMLPEK